MENSRVTIQYGSKPYLLVAPHGHQSDDYNTALIAERTASILNCNAIVNHGWQKSETLNINKDKANCNNFSHMKEVVADEFLHPILRNANGIAQKHGFCIVVWIHGMSNLVRKIANDPKIDIIFGNGAGKPYNSYTCPTALKEYVIYKFNDNNLKCYDSLPGTNYSGFAENNMNQLWARHYPEKKIMSFQLEIIKELREDDTMSILASDYMAEALKNMSSYKSWIKPLYIKINKI